MPLITLDNASLAYGHYPLLSRVSLVLQENERVGLIGRNGGGKSSLFKAIAGERALDDGVLWRQPGLRLGYVPQEPILDSADTVFEAVASGLGALRQVLTEYHAVSVAIAEQRGDEAALLERMMELQHELEAHDGWRVQSRVDAALSHLGLSPDVRVGELSGGWKKRVALARALVIEPQLLLLDEPTNHLDLASIEWLEDMLKAFNGSVLFITHDRRFLDNVATRIVELDRGQLGSFPGNFSAYQSKKAELLEAEATQSEKFDKVLAQEEVWIRKGIEARRTRNEGRVRRLERLRIERAQRRDRLGQVNFNLDSGERSGKLVAELSHVSKSFGDKVVIRDFSCIVARGDRIGLIGPNGAGKSTLLKLMLGELMPDSGSVKLGTKLTVAYFDQLREQLDDAATLTDVISPGSDFVEIGGERKHVISYLGDFLFPAERARAKVKSLSGGERNRLLLARLFTRPANVLVLDEPTNDLDIETLELLESLLMDYQGTLFLVSHDRTFLDNVVTQVIAFEGNGVLVESVGGYEDWARFKSAQTQAAARKQEAKSSTAPEKSKREPTRPGKTKLTFGETKELADLPAKIEALEAEQAQITARLCDDDLYRTQLDEAKRLQARFSAVEEALHTCLSRWEALEAKQGTADR